jgi:uncharacterized protein YaaW (UPF0174 family)
MAEPALLATDYDLISVLRWAGNDDLEPLVEYIKDKGKLTESLTSSDPYRLNSPNHTAYADYIAAEIQLFGANTMRSWVRGHGVKYEVIVKDVAKKLKVKTWFRNLDEIERDIHFKILGESYAQSGEQERRQMLEALGVNIPRDFEGKIPAVLPMAALVAIGAGGFLSYQIAVIVANSMAHAMIGQGLSFFGNALLTKSMSVFLGPVGLLLSGLLVANALFAGPAYRVTVPAVIHISYLRAKQREEIKAKKRAEFIRIAKIVALSVAVVVAIVIVVAMLTYK